MDLKSSRGVARRALVLASLTLSLGISSCASSAALNGSSSGLLAPAQVAGWRMEYETTSKDGVGISLFVMSEDKTRSRQEELSRSGEKEPLRTFYLNPASATTCVADAGCTTSRKGQEDFATAAVGERFLKEPWANVQPEGDRPKTRQSVAGVLSECVVQVTGAMSSEDTVCRALDGQFLTMYQLSDGTSVKIRTVQRMIDPKLLDPPAASPSGN